MASLPADLRAGFRPILQLRKRLVSAYRLTPRLGGSCQETALAAALPLALDSWAMHQVLELLQEPPQFRDPALVVPVHYPTLATMGARETYLQLCRQLPQRSRRQLILEVLDLPEELAPARVQELLSHLRPLCLALVVRMPRLTTAIEHLSGCGVEVSRWRPRALERYEHAGRADALWPAARALRECAACWWTSPTLGCAAPRTPRASTMSAATC